MLWLTGIQMALIYVLVKTWFPKWGPTIREKKWLCIWYLCFMLYGSMALWLYVPCSMFHVPCSSMQYQKNQHIQFKHTQAHFNSKGNITMIFSSFFCLLSVVCLVYIKCASYATKRRCSWVTLQILCQPAGNQPTWDNVCIWAIWLPACLTAWLLDSFAFYFNCWCCTAWSHNTILQKTQQRLEWNK